MAVGPVTSAPRGVVFWLFGVVSDGVFGEVFEGALDEVFDVVP